MVVSAVVSLTLTPMMCGRLLRPAREDRPGRIARLGEGGFERDAGRIPAHACAWTLRHQRLVLLIAVATLAGTIGLYVVVPKGFLPQQDTGVLIAVTEAAQSVSIPRLIELQTQVARDRRARPGGDRRGVVRRRRHDQRDAEHRPAHHRAEADRRARSGRRW